MLDTTLETDAERGRKTSGVKTNESLRVTGITMMERSTKRGRILAPFPGQCDSACNTRNLTATTLADTSHCKVVMGDHLSLVGWVNSPRTSLHGHDGSLIIP
jgi:hypothetical protein